MIQRIQSLYLLAIAILGIVLTFLPLIYLSTSINEPIQRIFELRATGLFETTPNLDMLSLEPIMFNGVWGLMLTTILIPLMALVILFLYRKRMLQARLNIFLGVLCLGYYGILFMYVWFAKMNLGLEWNISFWTCIPLICFVLTLGATRHILKDEALVRAADRIR